MDHNEASKELQVEIRETDQETPLTYPAQQQKRRPFWEKLGYYNTAILVFGTWAIIIALAVLFFIWGGIAHARKTHYFPAFWTNLIETRRFATRTVTLVSVVIRLATATQLGVFTAAMASLILERVGVATQDLPSISMIRCLNVGPHALALSVSNSKMTRELLPYGILIFLAILDAFALQFTSTILLSDFGRVEMTMATKTGKFLFGFDRNATEDSAVGYSGMDMWQSSPQSYQRFAEYSSGATKGSNYVDTGSALRAFLPFEESSASYQSPLQWNVRNYHGPALVLDARVVCVKPSMSNISFENGVYKITGSVDWKGTHPDLRPNPDLNSTDSLFKCVLPSPGNVSNRRWPLSLCNLGYHYAALAGSPRPDPPQYGWPTGLTTAHLVFNTTGQLEDLANDPENAELKAMNSSGPVWAKYGRHDASFDVSMCFFNPLPGDYRVLITSDQSGWDSYIQRDNKTNTYNTTDIRIAYGATRNHTAKDRNQLQLRPESNWTAAESQYAYGIATTNNYLWDKLSRYQDSYTNDSTSETSMFTDMPSPPYGVHRHHVAVVQDILQDTQDPALALQAIFTILMQMSYYDFASEFQYSQQGSYTNTLDLMVPSQWTFFGLVLGLLGLHFALLLIALVEFHAKSDMSLLGNAWQAVSQVMSDDTSNLVHHGATQTDREIERTMKEGGFAGDTTRLGRATSNGRIEAYTARRRQGLVYHAAPP